MDLESQMCEATKVKNSLLSVLEQLGYLKVPAARLKEELGILVQKRRNYFNREESVYRIVKLLDIDEATAVPTSMPTAIPRQTQKTLFS